MLTLNEKQLKEFDQVLDTLPHGYAKAIILFLSKVARDNQAAANQSKTEVKEESVVEEELITTENED